MQSWIDFVYPQVVLNKGLLFMSMEPAIASLGLTPDLAEIRIPTYFLEERSQVKNGRSYLWNSIFGPSKKRSCVTCDLQWLPLQELEERAAKLKLLAETPEASLQPMIPPEEADHAAQASVLDGPSGDVASVSSQEKQVRVL